MRVLWRWVKRLLGLAILVSLGLVAPVAWNEVSCATTTTSPTPYLPHLPPEHHRDQARSLMTYPEWHIVHAYDDYAKVVSTADPHDFGYLSAIAGFWSSLCALSKTSAYHGGFKGEIKQTVYVIGVSFTAELLFKAAYEETLGRLATVLRGNTRAPLDELSAKQARAYAGFLQQVPWYKWDFRADRRALQEEPATGLRDHERRLALGLEYGVKAAYADLIGQAVDQVGGDALSLRMIVSNMTETELAQFEGVTVIGPRGPGLEIETPRYRALTHLMDRMAKGGADFVEIAGNDAIMFTAISKQPKADGALYSVPRQGYADTRHLILVKVSDLAERLRTMQAQSGQGLTLEHIHDY